MKENNTKRTDLDIASDFDALFTDISEPASDQEISDYLMEAGYDMDKLKANGKILIDNLLTNNWRFRNPQVIHEAVKKINAIPLRENLGHEQLIAAIKQLKNAIDPQLSMVFRNLDELTDQDLRSILQELEYKANENGKTLDLDL
jgi:hypothetical protein